MSDGRNRNKTILLPYFYVALAAVNTVWIKGTLSLRVLLQVDGENVKNSFINTGKLPQHVKANKRQQRSICNKVDISQSVVETL